MINLIERSLIKPNQKKWLDVKHTVKHCAKDMPFVKVTETVCTKRNKIVVNLVIVG